MSKLKKCKNGKCKKGIIGNIKEYFTLRKDLKELKKLKENRLWLENRLEIVTEERLKDKNIKPVKPSYVSKYYYKSDLLHYYKNVDKKIEALQNKISKQVAEKELNKDKNIPTDIKNELMLFL